MGNFDKLVSLTVLFLVAIVLGVTLNSPGGEEDDGSDPLEGVRADLGGALSQEEGSPPGTSEPRGDTGSPGPSDSDLELAGARGPASPVQGSNAPPLLAAGVDSGPLADQSMSAGAELEGADLAASMPLVDPNTGAQRILRRFEGLGEGLSDDYRVYHWQANDTWRLVAKRFYGDPNRVDLLQRQNEDSQRPEVGDLIFMPVYELSQAYQPAHGASGTSDELTPTAAAQHRPGRRAEIARVSAARGSHEVLDGESLWSIAQLYYGAGSRWKELHEANLDVVPDADNLELGVVLVIPD